MAQGGHHCTDVTMTIKCDRAPEVVHHRQYPGVVHPPPGMGHITQNLARMRRRTTFLLQGDATPFSQHSADYPKLHFCGPASSDAHLNMSPLALRGCRRAGLGPFPDSARGRRCHALLPSLGVRQLGLAVLVLRRSPTRHLRRYHPHAAWHFAGGRCPGPGAAPHPPSLLLLIPTASLHVLYLRLLLLLLLFLLLLLLLFLLPSSQSSSPSPPLQAASLSPSWAPLVPPWTALSRTASRENCRCPHTCRSAASAAAPSQSPEHTQHGDGTRAHRT